MKLYYVPISPFARKVILTASVLGIRDKLELISMDIFNAPENFRKINPLIKVPALETDSGEYLVNSPFICQYLSQTTPGSANKIFPMGPDLWSALNVQAIADGGTDACMARRWEMHLRAPGKFDEKIDLRHKEKVVNALDYFTSNLFQFSKTDLTIKEISLICFIDYINLRFPHEKWENRFSQVFAWVKKWNENPIVKETYPK